MNYRLWGAIALVGLGAYLLWTNFAPELRSVGHELTGDAREISRDGASAQTRVLPIRVTFEVDPNYHGWGGLLSSRSQLPTLSASAEADGSAGQTASGGEVIRMNWDSSRCMRWDLRVLIAEDSELLTVEINETVSGWAALGADPIIERIPLHWSGSQRAITDFARIPVRGGWLSITQTAAVER